MQDMRDLFSMELLIAAEQVRIRPQSPVRGNLLSVGSTSSEEEFGNLEKSPPGNRMEIYWLLKGTRVQSIDENRPHSSAFSYDTR